MAQPCHVTNKTSQAPTVPVTSSRRKRQKGADTDGSVSTKHQSVMPSSPKKSRLGPSPEEHASLQTAEAGGSSAKEDTKYDKKKLMGKRKRSGTKREYKQVPEGLRDLIDRLCKKFQVKHAVWAQSADWREVNILGRGATRILEELRETAESEFPEYRFIAVESGPTHTTKLCSSSSRALHVIAEHMNKEPAHGTSELILKGQPESSTKSEIYIGCTAHGVLTEKQCEDLDTSNDIDRIETIRKEVEKSSTEYTLRAQLNNNNKKKDFSLHGPPQICYHHFSVDGEKCPKNRCAGYESPNCSHKYENDIALLKLDGRTVKQLRDGLGDKFQPFDRIVHLGDETATGRDEEYEEGRHIRFFVDKAGQLEEGDSGSVLYYKDKDKHMAFAMVVSKLGRAQNKSKLGYTAIFLRRALDDIEADYKIEALDLLKPAAAPDQSEKRRSKMISHPSENVLA